MADLTRQDAEREVARCLGEYAVEHDVPAIADACRELVGTWDVRQVEPEDFWRLVRLHALDDAGRDVSTPRGRGRGLVTAVTSYDSWVHPAGTGTGRCEVLPRVTPGRSAPRDGDLVVFRFRRPSQARSAPRDGDGQR